MLLVLYGMSFVFWVVTTITWARQNLIEKHTPQDILRQIHEWGCRGFCRWRKGRRIAWALKSKSGNCMAKSGKPLRFVLVLHSRGDRKPSYSSAYRVSMNGGSYIPPTRYRRWNADKVASFFCPVGPRSHCEREASSADLLNAHLCSSRDLG